MTKHECRSRNIQRHVLTTTHPGTHILPTCEGGFQYQARPGLASRRKHDLLLAWAPKQSPFFFFFFCFAVLPPDLAPLRGMTEKISIVFSILRHPAAISAT